MQAYNLEPIRADGLCNKAQFYGKKIAIDPVYPT